MASQENHKLVISLNGYGFFSAKELLEDKTGLIFCLFQFLAEPRLNMIGSCLFIYNKN
jgi:hypothetical protein